MTAAIESLNKTYPNKYKIGVKTSCDDIFINNPHINLDLSQKYQELFMDNKLVHLSHLHYHFLQNYCKEFERHLNIKLDLQVKKPYIYLTDEERDIPAFPGKYVIINAGRKDDYHTKHYGKENYQKIVNALCDKVTFVQVGEKHHYHPVLDNVVNLIGKTSARHLIKLCYHSLFGIGPISFIHHIYAAFEKPYFCIASGFEPISWEYYPTTIFFSSQGQLKCCQKGACWNGKLFGEGGKMCELPVIKENCDPIPECLNMINPQTIIDSIKGMLGRGLF